VLRLKKEMNAISAQDNFAKWAKVRREHDKAMAAHDQKGKSREIWEGQYTDEEQRRTSQRTGTRSIPRPTLRGGS